MSARPRARMPGPRTTRPRPRPSRPSRPSVRRPRPGQTRPRPRPSPRRGSSETRRRARSVPRQQDGARERVALPRQAIRGLTWLGRGVNALGLILTPTPAGGPDAEVPPWDRTWGRGTQLPRDPEVPPPEMPPLPNWAPPDVYIGPGRIEFQPLPMPDPFRPPVVPNIWTPEPIETFPDLTPRPRSVPAQTPVPLPPPARGDPVRYGNPRGRGENRSNVVPRDEVEIRFDFRPDGTVRIQRRLNPRRWERRRRDTKLRRWYLIALQTINRTWGVVDEAMQLGEAIAWNTYTKDGRYAMAVHRGNALEVFQGIGRGEYTVDVTGALVTHAIGQTMDRVIGKGSRYAQGQFNDAGWSSPTGFAAGPAL